MKTDKTERAKLLNKDGCVGLGNMNILYFTLDDFDSLINYRSINTDLLREFGKYGHKLYVFSPSERKKVHKNRFIKEDEATILKPKIGNIQKTSIIEKGISTVTIGNILIRAIKKELSDVKFDLILYCTPPITFNSAIEYVKKRDGAETYLLLKDIFPQNAVDIGLMSKSGIRGLLYRYFRRQEKKLYSISDHIGCMSPANVEYVIKHNPEVRTRQEISLKRSGKPIVEVCPNSIDVIDKSIDENTRKKIRETHGIPLGKIVFIYGGNLGKPQGIPFLIECLKKCEGIDGIYFLIVGNGTEYHMIQNYMETEKPKNAKLLRKLPKEDYDTMVGACDVGMIFLDHRFTIPNFPSRLLSYMQAKLPVLAVTDKATDIGKIIVDGGFGWWCESNDLDHFSRTVNKVLGVTNLSQLGKLAYDYLKNNYSSDNQFDMITNSLHS